MQHSWGTASWDTETCTTTSASLPLGNFSVLIALLIDLFFPSDCILAQIGNKCHDEAAE